MLCKVWVPIIQQLMANYWVLSLSFYSNMCGLQPFCQQGHPQSTWQYGGTSHLINKDCAVVGHSRVFLFQCIWTFPWRMKQTLHICKDVTCGHRNLQQGPNIIRHVPNCQLESHTHSSRLAFYMCSSQEGLTASYCNPVKLTFANFPLCIHLRLAAG